MRLRRAMVGAGTALSCAGLLRAESRPDRPGYSLLRFEEDWSVLRDVTDEDERDRWDSIKFIPLSDDGSIWLSVGGSTRLRLESWWGFNFLPPDGGDDTFLLWRALLHADLHVGENLRAFVEGKSALSTDRDLPGVRRALDVDTIALQQGFVDLRLAPATGTVLTLRYVF